MLNWYQKQIFLQNYWPKHTSSTTAKWLIKTPLNVPYHPLISCFELTLTPLFSSSSTTSISPTQDASLRLSSSILVRSISRTANLWHITSLLLCDTHYPHRLTIHMNSCLCKISVYDDLGKGSYHILVCPINCGQCFE
jgi:hypothetical protein